MSHAPPRVLYRTQFTVWSEKKVPEYGATPRIEDVARLVEVGDAYVSHTQQVAMNPHEVVQDPNWDHNEFFDNNNDNKE